jgi:hypothetical protein
LEYKKIVRKENRFPVQNKPAPGGKIVTTPDGDRKKEEEGKEGDHFSARVVRL